MSKKEKKPTAEIFFKDLPMIKVDKDKVDSSGHVIEREHITITAETSEKAKKIFLELSKK